MFLFCSGRVKRGGATVSDIQRAGSEPAIETDGPATETGPRGIGGWLLLIAFGQVIGTLRLLATLALHYSVPQNQEFFRQYPATAYGELALNAFMVLLAIWTLSLFFRESRYFPRFFVGEVVATIALPILNTVWVALTLSRQIGAPFSGFFFFEPVEIAQLGLAVIAALIWIPYVLRSRRVKNTFVN